MSNHEPDDMDNIGKEAEEAIKKKGKTCFELTGQRFLQGNAAAREGFWQVWSLSDKVKYEFFIK